MGGRVVIGTHHVRIGTAATPTTSNVQGRRQSGRESGDAGEGKGTSQDAERAAEELRDTLTGLLPPHHDAWRCVSGVRCDDAAPRREQ